MSSEDAMIETAEDLAAIVNATVNDDLKDAVKALFRKGDIVEVRAWDKNHTVYTGLGDSEDAKCTAAILGVLEKLEPGVWIRWREMATRKNWYKKFSARTLSGTRDALAKSGATVEETVEDGTGAPKRTGRLRLRYDGDEEAVTVTALAKKYTKVQKEAMEGKEEPGAKYVSID